MKKLLSIALCAAAITSFAAEVEIANVGVTSVTIPANQKNTIIAASFQDLSDTSKGVAINNLIKTATGLANGDQVMVFKGGAYYTFTWDGTAWNANTKVTGEGTSAGLDLTTQATVGEGLWFIRASAENQVTITLYGATSSTTTSTVTAKAWNLIGNPTTAAYSFEGKGVKGDSLITVVNGALCSYDRKTTGWYKTDATTGAPTKETPTVAAGMGIWYKPQSATTLDWSK